MVILSSLLYYELAFRNFSYSVTDMLVHQLPLNIKVCIVIMYISLQHVINIIDLKIIKRVLF